MDHQPSAIVDPAEMGWIVHRAAVSAEALGPWCQNAEQDLLALADRHITMVTDGDCSTKIAERADYALRLWQCVAYHWMRRVGNCPRNLKELVATLETNEITASAGLLYEVALAVALEKMEPRAATMFEQRYMPQVRSFARQTAGARGEDFVEDFTATLVLPRENAPPRIRQYQGKTPLLKWLRVVVTNYCLSQLRRKQPDALDSTSEAESVGESETPQDNRKCLDMLAPVIAAAIGWLEPEDRLLIKLLLLDEVPQLQVSKSLGIHSGNVTRRKQKIMDAIWNGIRTPQLEPNARADFRDCMEDVVAGHDSLLSRELAALVGSAFGPSREPLRKGGAR